MGSQDHCRCKRLEQKISQHEEVITQLLHMMASMNQVVTQLAGKQKRDAEKSLQQVSPSCFLARNPCMTFPY